ncbi:hypothetical protein J2Z30_009473 [Streptomyces iranensis]|uniref:Uncharacterized protein n=1 Tax=Streptomyces iranensis TaxID=576784 RepID=A0ABS4NAE9_9ACTN|nr:hypothetical protein [Streptomyces iranensis]
MGPILGAEFIVAAGHLASRAIEATSPRRPPGLGPRDSRNTLGQPAPSRALQPAPPPGVPPAQTSFEPGRARSAGLRSTFRRPRPDYPVEKVIARGTAEVQPIRRPQPLQQNPLEPIPETDCLPLSRPPPARRLRTEPQLLQQGIPLDARVETNMSPCRILRSSIRLRPGCWWRRSCLYRRTSITTHSSSLISRLRLSRPHPPATRSPTVPPCHTKITPQGLLSASACGASPAVCSQPRGALLQR